MDAHVWVSQRTGYKRGFASKVITCERNMSHDHTEAFGQCMFIHHIGTSRWRRSKTKTINHRANYFVLRPRHQTLTIYFDRAPSHETKCKTCLYSMNGTKPMLGKQIKGVTFMIETRSNGKRFYCTLVWKYILEFRCPEHLQGDERIGFNFFRKQPRFASTGSLQSRPRVSAQVYPVRTHKCLGSGVCNETLTTLGLGDA